MGSTDNGWHLTIKSTSCTQENYMTEIKIALYAMHVLVYGGAYMLVSIAGSFKDAHSKCYVIWRLIQDDFI